MQAGLQVRLSGAPNRGSASANSRNARKYDSKFRCRTRSPPCSGRRTPAPAPDDARMASVSWISPFLPAASRRAPRRSRAQGRSARQSPGCSAPPRRRLLHDIVDFEDVAAAPRAGDAVLGGCRKGHLLERDDRRASRSRKHCSIRRTTSLSACMPMIESRARRRTAGCRRRRARRERRGRGRASAAGVCTGTARPRARTRAPRADPPCALAQRLISSPFRSKWFSMEAFPGPVTKRIRFMPTRSAPRRRTARPACGRRQHLLGLRLGGRQQPRAEPATGTTRCRCPWRLRFYKPSKVGDNGATHA